MCTLPIVISQTKYFLPPIWLPIQEDSLIELYKETSAEMDERNRRIILAVRECTHAWEDGNRMLW